MLNKIIEEKKVQWVESNMNKEEREPKRLTLEQMSFSVIFGEEAAKEAKEKAARRTERVLPKLKKEHELIMAHFEETEAFIAEQQTKAESEDPVKHKILLDKQGFNKKPTEFISIIQNRLPGEVEEVTIEELAKAVKAGRTFKTSYLTGKTQDTFVSSSLIAIDIDNKGEELKKYGYKTLEAFKEDVEKSLIKPALIYTTFSHTNVCHKYRAIFQLDRVITNLNELNAIAAVIKEEYPYADTKVSVTHCIYGGKDIIDLNPKEFVSLEVDFNDTLSESMYKAAEIKSKDYEKRSITKENIIENLKPLRNKYEGKEIDVNGSFEWINKNIKLTTVLGYDVNTQFRCILPEHEDTHPSARISETIDGRQNYICSCTKTYTSLMDLLAIVLDMDKVEIQYLIADALGLTIGSKYQREMRLLIADTKANLMSMIKPGTVLYKEMKYLWGTLNIIQDFASSKITTKSISVNEKRPTFFMSRTQLVSEMRRLNIAGSSNAKSKLDQLKDLGFIRPLKDDEIEKAALLEANKEKNKLMALINKKYLNRVEFYELCAITPSMIKKAEDLIALRKQLGAKKDKMNMTRRINTYGAKHTADVNIQGNITKKVCFNKNQKEMDKLIGLARNLIVTQGYFTEDQLRKAFDPKRKKRKETVINLINDTIPAIITVLGIKKDRVKKETRNLYSIPDNIKTNTTIYHWQK